MFLYIFNYCWFTTFAKDSRHTGFFSEVGRNHCLGSMKLPKFVLAKTVFFFGYAILIYLKNCIAYITSPNLDRYSVALGMDRPAYRCSAAMDMDRLGIV